MSKIHCGITFILTAFTKLKVVICWVINDADTGDILRGGT